MKARKVNRLFEELQSPNLSRSKEDEIKNSLREDKEAWQDFFESREDRGALLPDELLALYYSALFEKEERRSSPVARYLRLALLRLKMVRERFAFKNKGFAGAGVALAVALLTFFWPPGGEEKNLSRPKGGSISEKWIPHKLTLLTLGSEGEVVEPSKPIKRKVGENLLFSIQSKESGHLHLGLLTERGIETFYPEGGESRPFSVEENNRPLRGERGIVSYVVERGEPSLRFCSFLARKKGMGLEYEDMATLAEEGENCVDVEVRY